MESQQSIVLQKKMMIVLSVFIMFIFSAIYLESYPQIEMNQPVFLEENPENIAIVRQEDKMIDDTMEQVKVQYLMNKKITVASVGETISDEINKIMTSQNSKAENSTEAFDMIFK